MILANDKIRIIPKEPCHATYIYRWYHAGGYEDFFGNMPSMNVQDSISFNPDGLNFMIVNFSNPQEVVGMFSLTNIEERHRNLHFGILIDKKYHGLKIAKDSSKLMIYYIMNCMNMFKVIARIDSENSVSKKLTESFGFELEGVLKQEIYHNGEFRDILRYRITKGVFNKKYKEEIESSEKVASEENKVVIPIRK